jgi:hypothetical protein
MEQSPSKELIVAELVNKFLAFRGTRRFITVYSSFRHISLSLARLIQSTPSHTISLRSNLILSPI